MASRADLYKVLMQKCGYEARDEQTRPKRLRIVGRLHKDRWSFFLPVIHRLMTKSVKVNWNVDVSKSYFLFDGKVRFGWRLIFECPDGVETVLDDIISTIIQAPQPSRVEISSMTLPGYRPGQIRGGTNAKGKGASSVFKPVVGEAAVAKIRQGG